jgi:transposase InsO family protein
VWVGDITYVPTGECRLYPAVLLDLCSRRVVGWARGRTIDRSLTLRADGERRDIELARQPASKLRGKLLVDPDDHAARTGWSRRRLA